LFSATTSTKGRIVIGGIITSITRFLGIESNPDDQVSGFELLDKAAFELIGFYKVECGHLYWFYPGDRLMPLLNVARTTLVNHSNLSYLPGDEDLVHPAPSPSPSSFAKPSSSAPSPTPIM